MATKIGKGRGQALSCADIFGSKDKSLSHFCDFACGGIVTAFQSEWDKAAADFAKAAKLKPNEVAPELALIQLISGDLNGYRQTFKALLARFRKTDDVDALYDAVWVGVAAPKAMADPNELVRLAKELVVTPSSGCRNPYSALGAALYRAGRLKAAVRTLNKSIKINKGGREWDWLFFSDGSSTTVRSNR